MVCLKSSRIDRRVLGQFAIVSAIALGLVLCWGGAQLWRYFHRGHSNSDPLVVAFEKNVIQGIGTLRPTFAFQLGQLDYSRKQAFANELLWYLRDPSPDLRAGTCLALSSLGVTLPAAVPTLSRLTIEDPALNVRIAAALALGRVGSSARDAVPDLIKAAANERNPYREQAALALKSIGGGASTSAPLMNQLTNDSEGGARASAIAALGTVAPPTSESVKSLIRALQDSDSRVRREAAKTAQKYGRAAKPALPFIVKLLSDNNLHVEQSAAMALQKVGPTSEEAVTALGQIIQRPAGGVANDLIRYAATQALGSAGPVGYKAVPFLTKALNDSFPLVRSAAAESLAMIGWKTPKAVIGIRQIAMQSKSRTGALYEIVFRDPHSKETFDLIAKATEDTDPKVRWTAVDLLPQAAPDGTTIQTLLNTALKDSDSGVRDVAQAVLSKAGHS